MVTKSRDLSLFFYFIYGMNNKLKYLTHQKQQMKFLIL